MRNRIMTLATLILIIGFMSAQAEISNKESKHYTSIDVTANDNWQPEGFEAFPVLHAKLVNQPPVIDGQADDPAWDRVKALTLPLDYGSVTETTLKAVYTDTEVFLLVSWPDPDKDDQHRPWVLDSEQGRYVEGPQIEDGVMVTMEEGCDWSPSPLLGYVFDFDGWRWLAARSNPLGQAVDVNGHVQERRDRHMDTQYQRRLQEPYWNMRLAGSGRPGYLTKSWQELNREFIHFPLDGEGPEVYVSMNPDMDLKKRNKKIEFVTQHPAPDVDPEAVKAGQTPEPVVPQFQPLRLEGNAGDVAAKGHWEDGRWTVEFRRALITPAGNRSDSTFDRATQFSVLVFDGTERLDEASESGRILLEFEPGPGFESDDLAQNQ